MWLFSPIFHENCCFLLLNILNKAVTRHTLLFQFQNILIYQSQLFLKGYLIICLAIFFRQNDVNQQYLTHPAKSQYTKSCYLITCEGKEFILIRKEAFSAHGGVSRPSARLLLFVCCVCVWAAQGMPKLYLLPKFDQDIVLFFNTK